MFDIPKKYKVKKKFALKTFIPKELKPGEKKKLKEALNKVVLAYQISGEEIPSLINENYNCAVIMFFDVELSNIKYSKFVSGVMQSLIKSLCVFRFYDTNYEIYSFSTKRLNLQDSSEIIIEDSILTGAMPVQLSTQEKENYLKHFQLESLLNKTNKYSFYVEIMTKAFIISNLHLFSRVSELLQSKVWYNLEDSLAVLRKLKKLESLKQEITRTSRAIDKVNINTKMKSLIQELEKYI